MSFLEVLQIMFVVIKAAGLVDWSWGLTLLPLWIVIGFAILEVIFD